MSLYDPSTGQWYNYSPSSYIGDTGDDQPVKYGYGEGETFPWLKPTQPLPRPSSYTPSSLSAATAPPGGSPALVDPTSTDAYALASQVLAGEYQQWEKQFAPLELQAIQNTSLANPQVLTNAVNTATQNAAASNAAIAGISERQNAAMGLKSTPQQQTEINRILNIDASLNTAGAENQARLNQRALDADILFGSAPNPNIINSYSSKPTSRTLS